MKPPSAEERRQFILNYMKTNSFADVSYFRDVLKVSEMTIRRDLSKLEKDNRILRVYGGARSMPKEMYEAPLLKRVKSHSKEKDIIGRYAASLVEEGDVIMLDASSTAYAMIKHLNINITVITSNISVALALANNEKIDVILLGGKLRKTALSLVGYEVSQMLENYHADKAFISSKSVDIEHGLTDATSDEAEVKKAMIASSHEVYLLMDSSKLDTCAFYKVRPIKDFKQIIVEKSSEITVRQQEFLKGCEDMGIRVHYAK